ncbi:MAG: AEC family transporter [Rudaea sp.]
MLLLFVCLVLGMLVARFANPPPGMAHGLNWWILYIALPAIVLELIPRVHFDPQLWFPVVSMWLVFAGAWLLFGVLGPRLGWSRARTGAMILVCGLGNTAFMGYPMTRALYGESGLTLAVVADQLGNFPLLIIGGIGVASVYAGRQADLRTIVRRILTFPAFIALIVGILVGCLGGWPKFVDSLFHPIGSTLTPLALFSVGLQFRFHPGERQFGAATLGLAWKLALAPVLCWSLGIASGIGGLILRVSVLQAAMAPMVSAAILADEYDLDPPLANTVLGAGIVLSMLTVPLAYWLLGG